MSVNKDVFWPELLLTDSRLPTMSIFLAGYYTNVDSDHYGIRECAEEVFDALRRPSIDGSQPPIKYKNIIFVCHSLGGIVTRYLLEAKREYFRNNNLGVVLVASPSIGSDYADKFSKVAGFYRNRVGKQLSLNSEILSDLDGRFKSFLDTRENETFFGVEAIEHLGFFHMRWLPGFAPVVLKNSAARYFPEPRTLAGTNHSTIVKPDSHSHVSHNFLVDYFNNIFLRGSLPSRGQVKVNSAPGYTQGFNSAALFDIYDKSCEPFYLERGIDSQVAADFSVASFWAYGPSGCGKTSIIKRLLCIKNIKAIEMCFSQCTRENPREAFITEILETIHIQLYGHIDASDRSFNTLVRLISKVLRENESLFIYIDEVPSMLLGGRTMEDELVILIEDILTSVKQVSNGNEFKIIVSSLGRPNLDLGRNVAKLNGYLRICECTLWPEGELNRLVALIAPCISDGVAQELATTLASRAHGSPRFLKTFFKNRIAHPEKDNSELLAISEHGFVS